MNAKANKDQDISNLLLESGPEGQGGTGEYQTDSIIPTTLSLTLDDVDLFDKNPRFIKNDKYDTLKESIRQDNRVSGSFSVTRRPAEAKYIVDAGANTRLKILKELYSETGDRSFYQIEVMFRPYTSEPHLIVNHMKENDDRSDYKFIERAMGVRALALELENLTGDSLSTRKLSEYLKEKHGYSISQSLIVRLNYTVDVLYPCIPLALHAGMGKPKVEALRRLESANKAYWKAHGFNTEAFTLLYHSILTNLDEDLFEIGDVKQELLLAFKEKLQTKLEDYQGPITMDAIEFEIAHFNEEPEVCTMLNGNADESHGWTTLNSASDVSTDGSLISAPGVDSSPPSLRTTPLERMQTLLPEESSEGSNHSNTQAVTQTRAASKDLAQARHEIRTLALTVPSSVIARSIQEVNNGYGFYMEFPLHDEPFMDEQIHFWVMLFWLSRTEALTGISGHIAEARNEVYQLCISGDQPLDAKRYEYCWSLGNTIEESLLQKSKQTVDERRPNIVQDLMFKGWEFFPFYSELMFRINDLNAQFDDQTLGFNTWWENQQ